MRCRPCPNFFFVVLMAVSTTIVKSSTNIVDFSRPFQDSLCFRANLRITCDINQSCPHHREGSFGDREVTSLLTRRICRFIFFPIFSEVALSKTSRKTFQNVSSELFRLIPGSRLPFLPRRKFKAQSRNVCMMAIDIFRNSCSGSLRRDVQNLTGFRQMMKRRKSSTEK